MGDLQPGHDPRARRIGLLVPSTNSVMEPDLAAGLAGMATVHTARMPLATVTADAERAMMTSAPSVAADLASLDLALCVFGCTSAGAVAGADESDGMSRLSDELQSACKAPAVAVLECVAERLRWIEAQQVAVLTPYDAELTATVGGQVAVAGFEVTVCEGLGHRDNAAIGAMSPASIVDVVTERLAGCTADAVFVSCTNLRAFEARDAIEEALGLPVVTSNSAVVDVIAERITGARHAGLVS